MTKNPERLYLQHEQPGFLRFGGARMALIDVLAGFWGLRRQMEAIGGAELGRAIFQQSGANGGASFAASQISQGARDPETDFVECLVAFQDAGFGQFEILDFKWPLGSILIRGRHAFEAWAEIAHGGNAEDPVCAYTSGVLVGFINVITGRSDVVCIERSCAVQTGEECLFELLPLAQARGAQVVSFNHDPAIGRQLNLIEILFDNMPMGIAVIDREMKLRRFNPTWLEMYQARGPAERIPAALGTCFLDLLPGSEVGIKAIFEQVFEGEMIRDPVFRIEVEGQVSYWDTSIAPLREGEKIVGAVLVITDATSRVADSQQLEMQVAERTQELKTLMGIQQAISSRLDREGVLQRVADEARKLSRCDLSAVYLIEADEVEIAVTSGEGPDDVVGTRIPLKDSITGAAIRERRTLKVIDTWLDRRVQRKVADYAGVRSLLVTPLLLDQEPIGTITVANRQPGDFSLDAERVLETLASSVVIGLENARLFSSEQGRRQVAESLRDLLAMLNTGLPFKEMLEYIAEKASLLLDAEASVIYSYQPEGASLEFQASSGFENCALPPDVLPCTTDFAEGISANGLPFSRAHYIAQNFSEADAAAILGVWLEEVRQQFKHFIGMPLVIGGSLFGVLGLFFSGEHAIGASRSDLLQQLATQSSLAIENARLRERIHLAAIRDERNRLARDLHDAVTQTLFSSSLIADVLPQIWERDIDAGKARLEELRGLTRGALAEMRALLLELRPAAFEAMEIEELLKQLATSIASRAQLPVSFETDGVCSLPVEIKTAFYRVAQEALNNIAKHANANQVRLILRCEGAGAHLEIIDDGVGFARLARDVETLGLGIMRERARQIGARLRVKSAPGAGTKITLTWPQAGGKQ